MHIETPKKALNKSDEQVFTFLTKVQNFKALMPENIDKFEVLDEKTFKFALKGMPEIVLTLKEEHPNNKIILGSASGKLPFTLTSDIVSTGDNSCEVGLGFEGEFNAMMAMMIKGPITNFMQTLSQNMEKI
jgi:carbon monoxide dehydrogenase subunit G